MSSRPLKDNTPHKHLSSIQLQMSSCKLAECLKMPSQLQHNNQRREVIMTLLESFLVIVLKLHPGVEDFHEVQRKQQQQIQYRAMLQEQMEEVKKTQSRRKRRKKRQRKETMRIQREINEMNRKYNLEKDKPMKCPKTFFNIEWASRIFRHNIKQCRNMLSYSKTMPNKRY